MNPSPTEPRPRRRRDPEASRAAILEATRQALAENGYARATIRDIARRAGVTHGLVMRHFGSKEQLMIAALPLADEIERVVADGDGETLPERIAHGYVQRMETSGSEDPLIALIRSAATNEGIARHMFEELQRRTVDIYRRMLRGDDVDERIGLLAAFLVGVTFNRYVVAVGPVAGMSPAALERHIAGALREILGPALRR